MQMPIEHGSMDLICFDREAFYLVFEELKNEIKNANSVEEEWLNTDEAMNLLRITSKTTLKKICDEGQVWFSRLSPKHILYNKASILSHIENRSKNRL